MLQWLEENIGTILISLFLLAAVVAIIINLISKKRRGESACGCGGSCAGCPMGCNCHSRKETP
ncbi:MAG TPA: FeoB-associated Cys-rich membrane protein [Candidatus Aphodomonas merdavium]|nr:FeoB-associated Cys-rich membrane protein [Candidatus Aphodomonas merdavium]